MNKETDHDHQEDKKKKKKKNKMKKKEKEKERRWWCCFGFGDVFRCLLLSCVARIDVADT